MILLRANQELKLTFDKLIKTMKVPVKWNGLFAVIDNYIILQGEVRSLFFHFDSKKVVTNIIDIPIKEENIEMTGDNVYVRNVINIILYAFGKWGVINGLKVEKNYAQLNQLFKGILREIRVEPEYNQEHFSFYREGIRITYEDVVQFALEHQEETAKEDSEDGGLWHKLVWKRRQKEITHVETNLAERLRERLGNNFYKVGYLCPNCKKMLHMVVYPLGREFRIETEEGAVLLARAATCNFCNAFYTPRPGKLFSEGDVYTMEFADDRKAYEDYLELLGKRGDRVSNSRFNEFVDKKNRGEEPKKEIDQTTLEKFCENPSAYSPEEVERIKERMEEGFYPDAKISRLERKIKSYQKEENRKGEKKEHPSAGQHHAKKEEKEAGGKAVYSHTAEKQGREEKQTKTGDGLAPAGADISIDRNRAGEPDISAGRNRAGEPDVSTDRNRAGEPDTSASQKESLASTASREELRQKYEAKLKVCDRFSERQLREFRDQILHEKGFEPKERQDYLEQVEEHLWKGRMEQLSKKADACKGKTYVVIKRVYDEIDKEEIPKNMKQPLLEKLQGWMKEQGEQEVRQLMDNMPPTLNRAGYRQFVERLHSYEGMNLAPYEEKLHQRREQAERREVEELVKRARKITKEDYKELLKRLEEGDFLPELILPYQKKVDEKIRQMDADEIAGICLNPMEMSFEEGMEAYRKIEEGDFLPELKEDALKMLTKRLSKIKTDECELLVKKLKNEMQEANIAENPRHYFYPARKVLLEQTSPGETEVIDFAAASYAAGRGLFEYPILVVDTSRNGSGKEGILLTPDHLYYSTILNAYGIPIASIKNITASTGLLNKGCYVHQKDGNKIKIPYAVDTKDLPAYAQILDEMITYLKEKPESRELNYLAKEKHETICCFRCGCTYKGGTVCPKCGYKNNV